MPQCAGAGIVLELPHHTIVTQEFEIVDIAAMLGFQACFQ